MLLFISVNCIAQKAGKTEVKEIFFEISYVYPANDTMIVFLKGANSLGLQKGASATA